MSLPMSPCWLAAASSGSRSTGRRPAAAGRPARRGHAGSRASPGRPACARRPHPDLRTPSRPSWAGARSRCRRWALRHRRSGAEQPQQRAEQAMATAREGGGTGADGMACEVVSMMMARPTSCVHRDHEHPNDLTHFDAHGQAHMVDVGAKPSTHRVAMADGLIRMQPDTLRASAKARPPRATCWASPASPPSRPPSAPRT